MAKHKPDLVAQVEGVSKKFCRQLHRSLRYGVVDMCREAVGLGPTKHLRPGEFWANRDVNLEVRRGESIALMGANGAGKSTLLKLIHGLIRPDEGRIRVRGRMGALTQLGAGFNPILSGRENVYINAAILGFAKAEVDRRMDEMLDFSGLSEAIDDPIRTYSSGMRARLGYSIAAFLNPDLLLMDEVLATGDIAFRMKCYAHLEGLIAQGTSIIIVTHMVGRIARACNRFIVLDQGRKFYDGSVDEGLQVYRKLLKLQDGEGEENESDDSLVHQAVMSTVKAPQPEGMQIVAAPLGAAVIEDLQVLDDAGQTVEAVEHNEPMKIRIRVNASSRVKGLRLRLLFENDGDVLTVANCPRKLSLAKDAVHEVEVAIPRLSLLAGSFQVRAFLLGGRPPQIISEKRVVLQVKSKHRPGLFTLPHRWIEIDSAKIE